MSEAPRDRTSAKWRAYPQDVLPLWVAEMDFELAPPIATALHAAIDRSDTGYRWDAGLPQALAGFAERRLGWRIDPDRVTAVGDVFVAMEQSLRRLAPHGAVVITPPVYPPFFSMVNRVVDRPLVEVALLDDRLDLPRLAEAFARDEVGAFLLSNPHNPTGTIHTPDELRAVAELAREHGVVVVADEIWAPLPLNGRRVHPYLALGEDLTAPDVCLVSASKAFNLAGLKCAQMVTGSAEGAKRLADAMPVEATYSASHFGVIAAIAAYTEGDEWLTNTLRVISGNARLLGELLDELTPGIGYRPPEATYLAWLDCRGLDLPVDPAEFFRENARVALNSGSDFGAPGVGFARLNLATHPTVIEEAVDRMARALDAR